MSSPEQDLLRLTAAIAQSASPALSCHYDQANQLLSTIDSLDLYTVSEPQQFIRLLFSLRDKMTNYFKRLAVSDLPTSLLKKTISQSLEGLYSALVSKLLITGQHSPLVEFWPLATARFKDTTVQQLFGSPMKLNFICQLIKKEPSVDLSCIENKLRPAEAQKILRNLRTKRQVQALLRLAHDSGALLQSLLLLWSQRQFVNEADKGQQLAVTSAIDSLARNRLAEGQTLKFIMEGIHLRLDVSSQSLQYIKRCGLFLWKTLSQVYGLPIPPQDDELVVLDLFDQPVQSVKTIPQSCPAPAVSPQQPAASDQIFGGFEDTQILANLGGFSHPVSLFDCLHGIRSDHPVRKTVSLQRVSFLIQQSQDLPAIYDQLCQALLRVDQSLDEKCYQLRDKALVVLLVKRPATSSLLLAQLVDGKFSSIGLKLLIIKTFVAAIQQVASHPSKQQDNSGDQICLLQKVSTVYKKAVVVKKSPAPTRVSARLKCLQKHELQLVKSQPFFNLLYQLLDCFYFPFIARLGKLRTYFPKHPQLAIQGFRLVAAVLNNTVNALRQVQILDCALDAIQSMGSCAEVAAQRQKWQVLYLVAQRLAQTRGCDLLLHRFLAVLQSGHGSSQDPAIRHLKQLIRQIIN